MAVATSTVPTDVGLRREMGFIGATWASVTSIIGSGWLFGSWKGAYSTGTSAILAWIIGGVCIIILALVHAELGGMYPVSGGTARFPHFAFGSVGGISFGFFSWVQAITVAPIECFAVMQYLSYYWHGVFNADTGNVTALGTWLSILLMASFTAINFLGMRLFSRVNSGITWWKVAIPVLTIIVLLFHFHGGNFNSHGGFLPLGTKALFAAIPGAGMIFAYLGFEQADQLAGEIKDPARNLPRAIITAILLCTAIYVMLQIVFIAPTACRSRCAARRGRAPRSAGSSRPRSDRRTTTAPGRADRARSSRARRVGSHCPPTHGVHRLTLSTDSHCPPIERPGLRSSLRGSAARSRYERRDRADLQRTDRSADLSA